ncbi:NAD(P)/FAD-dependent oxidoreductase [soil metagenome]
MPPTSSTPDAYDVIVLGAGAAGENVAGVAASHGLDVAIVEHALVGGECSYWACIPSKVLLRPVELRQATMRAAGVEESEIDARAVLARRDEVVGEWDDTSQVEWLDSVDVTLLRGHGRLTGERAITVEREDGSVDRYLARKAVVVATGSSASVPSIEGIADARPWTSRDATSAGAVPERLVVIGGGVVGVEMAQAWRSLGSREVTIIQIADSLLAAEEPEAAAEVEQALTDSGVVVHTNATTKAVERPRADGPVTVRFSTDEGTIEIEADEVLVATGRKPNTMNVGVETVGLEPGATIEVDDHMRAVAVGGGWLYAVGDVNGRALLTHIGKYQARVAGAHLAGLDARATADQRAIPRVVFTTPRLAAVGRTESQAREAGIDVRTVSFDIADIGATATMGLGYQGTCKLVIDAARHVIVGATFVGPSAGELLHSATIAIVGEVPLSTLWHAIPSFPTLSEVWLRLLEGYQTEYGHQFL